METEDRERPLLNVHHGGVWAHLHQLAYHDVPVALRVIVFEAQQRHDATVEYAPKFCPTFMIRAAFQSF